MEKLLRKIAKKFNSRRKSNVFRDVVRVEAKKDSLVIKSKKEEEVEGRLVLRKAEMSEVSLIIRTRSIALQVEEVAKRLKRLKEIGAKVKLGQKTESDDLVVKILPQIEEVTFEGVKIRKSQKSQKTFELSVNTDGEKEEIATTLDKIKKVMELWEE